MFAAAEVLVESGPGDDAAGDGAGDLPHDELESVAADKPPRACGVVGRGGGATRIVIDALKIRRVSDMAVDGGAVHVDIKDREKNPDAAHTAVGELAFLDFDDVGDASVRRRDDDPRASRNLPCRITKEPQGKEQESAGNEREPGKKIECGDGGRGQAEDEPDALL